MSVAYELDLIDAEPSAPSVSSVPGALPDHVRPGRHGVPGAPRRLVAVPAAAPHPRREARVLAPPAPAVLRPLDDPHPLRLTRRGVVVLTAVVTVLGAAVVALAALCAPTSTASGSVGPSTVTVHAGDTLWSIASRAAPNTDPAAKVASIERLNHLHGAVLTPGERLRVR